MRLKWIKFTAALKKNAWKILQTLLTPLAKLEMRIIDNNSHKIRAKCEKITDDELMERFAKYIVKDLIKNKSKFNEYKEFMLFHNGAYRYNTHDEFEERILYSLHNIDHSCKDKILKRWHYYGEKAKLYYSFNEKNNAKEMIAYERKLNSILKEKLNELGVYAEYEDIREKNYRGKGDKYDFYGRWLNRIGYEKSLIVKVD